MSVTLSTLSGCSATKDITSLLASGALTITQALAYKVGSDVMIQITYSDASVSYVKVKNGRLKIGGASNQFDTGTEVLWQS
jgi:hypothetical protein